MSASRQLDLQPVHYSYGRHLPINDALDRPWKFPNMPDEISIPCGNTGNAIADGSHCCDMVDVIDNIANVSMDETLDSASLIHDKETSIFSAFHRMTVQLRIYYQLTMTQ